MKIKQQTMIISNQQTAPPPHHYNSMLNSILPNNCNNINNSNSYNLTSPKNNKSKKKQKQQHRQQFERKSQYKDQQKQQQIHISPVLTPTRGIQQQRLISPMNLQTTPDEKQQQNFSNKDISKQQKLRMQSLSTSKNNDNVYKTFSFQDELRSNSKSNNNNMKQSKQTASLQQIQLQQQQLLQQQQQFENIKKFDSKPKWVSYFNNLYNHNSQSNVQLGTIKIQNQNYQCQKIVVNLHSQGSQKRLNNISNSIGRQQVQSPQSKIQKNQIKQNDKSQDLQSHLDSQIDQTQQECANIQLQNLNQDIQIQQDYKMQIQNDNDKDCQDTNTLNQQIYNDNFNNNYIEMPNEYLIENLPSNDNYQQIQQQYVYDDNFVTFQQQQQLNQYLPTGVSMFEGPLSTSSHKSQASSMHEEQPLFENLPLPVQRPIIESNSVLKRSLNNSNQNSLQNTNRSIVQNSIISIKQDKSEILKKVFVGFKVRKILFGRRLKTLTQKILSLNQQLQQAMQETQQPNESFTVKQIDMQLKLKKELFINTFHELYKVPHWYRASKMSENIRERKREIIRTRLRQQSLNSAQGFYNNNKSLLENSFLKDEIEALTYQSQNDDQQQQQFVFNNKINKQNKLNDSFNSQNLVLSKIQSHDNLQSNQIKFNKQRSNEDKIKGEIDKQKIQDEQSCNDKKQNRVTFRESIQSSIKSYKNIQQNNQQSINVQDNQQDKQQVNYQENENKLQANQQDESNIEKIVISFQEIYEQEMEKFKQIKIERSSSRERSGLRDRSFQNESIHSKIREFQNKIQNQKDMNNNKQNSEQDNDSQKTTSLSQNYDSTLFQTKQFTNDLVKQQPNQVQINFHKKASTYLQDKINDIPIVKQSHLNLESDHQLSLSMSDQLNSSMKSSQLGSNFKRVQESDLKSCSKNLEQVYYNRLKGKYTKVSSKIDCWQPNNTHIKSPLRNQNKKSSQQIQDDNSSVSTPPSKQKFTSPTQISLSKLNNNNNNKNTQAKKGYLKTVQVKECILITPSTQASYSETLDSNKSSQFTQIKQQKLEHLNEIN